jgi:hypothetical protein
LITVLNSSDLEPAGCASESDRSSSGIAGVAAAAVAGTVAAAMGDCVAVAARIAVAAATVTGTCSTAADVRFIAGAAVAEGTVAVVAAPDAAFNVTVPDVTVPDVPVSAVPVAGSSFNSRLGAACFAAAAGALAPSAICGITSPS